MKKTKILIPVICGILAVSAAFGVNAYTHQSRNISVDSYTSENTFEDMSATVALCSDEKYPFLLTLTANEFVGRPYTYSLNENAVKQLENSGIQAGDFRRSHFFRNCHYRM